MIFNPTRSRIKIPPGLELKLLGKDVGLVGNVKELLMAL